VTALTCYLHAKADLDSVLDLRFFAGVEGEGVWRWDSEVSDWIQVGVWDEVHQKLKHVYICEHYFVHNLQLHVLGVHI